MATIKAKINSKNRVPSMATVMNAVKEAVHETESCSHDDHGEVSVFLTRVESKLLLLFKDSNSTNSIKG